MNIKIAFMGLGALSFLILVFMHISMFNYIYDDAYIHFRIAENLINFHVPYFNLNEPFMSSSSTVWTLFLSAVYYIIGDNYIYSISIFNSLFIISGVYVYKLIVEKYILRNMTALEVLIFIITIISIILPSSMGMMEVPLALFLVALSLYLFSKESIYGFIFLTIAIFLRLEIAIFFIMFAIYFSYKNPKTLIKILFIFVIFSSPFIVYDLYYFGTIVPLTVKAKDLVYELSIFEVALNALPSLYGLYGKIFEFFLIMSLFFLVYQDRNNINFNPLTVFSISGFLLLFAYILKSTFLFGWYIPLFTIPISLFIIYFLFVKNRTLYLILLLLIFSPFYKESAKALYASFTKEYDIYHEFKSGARVKKYLEVSKNLYLKYPNATLLTSEIGGLGYGFKGYVLDGMGLIQPQCLKYHPMSIPEERSAGGIGAIPPGCVKEYMPEIIISYDVFIELLSKNDILNNYQHYKLPVFTNEDLKLTKDAEIWGSRNLNIYIRKDVDNGL